MLFHSPNTQFEFVPKLFINNIEIERVENFNFLRLNINENLSWKSHIDKITVKISKSGGIINRLKHFLPTDILRTIYCSTVQSNLLYSLLSWGYDCNRIAKSQKRIIRNICGQKYNAHTEPLFKKLDLLKIDDLLELKTLKFYYNLKKGTVPEYFKTYKVQRRFEIHGRNTRNKSLIATNKTRLKLADKCLRNNIASVLHSTPQIALDKVKTHSPEGFINYVKDIILKSYSNECNTRNCYVCAS